MESMLEKAGYAAAVNTEHITEAMDAFAVTHDLILMGRTRRRLQGEEIEAKKTDVLPSTDPLIVKLLDDSASASEPPPAAGLR